MYEQHRVKDAVIKCLLTIISWITDNSTIDNNYVHFLNRYTFLFTANHYPRKSNPDYRFTKGFCDLYLKLKFNKRYVLLLIYVAFYNA